MQFINLIILNFTFLNLGTFYSTFLLKTRVAKNRPNYPSWLHRCWWRMLKEQMCWWQVWDVDDRFTIVVTDLLHRENHQPNEKVANIMILPPTAAISHHHKVTNITISPTSLSPSEFDVFVGFIFCRPGSRNLWTASNSNSVLISWILR